MLKTFVKVVQHNYQVPFYYFYFKTIITNFGFSFKFKIIVINIGFQNYF